MIASHAHDHHQHAHHHRAGEGHPAAIVSSSILRLGVLTRLLVAAALIVVIWSVTFWAMA